MGRDQSDAEQGPAAFLYVDVLGARAQPRMRRTSDPLAGMEGRSTVCGRKKNGRRTDDGNHDE